MKVTSNTSACSRADDLVTYLYGETDESQALDFLKHTKACASCRDELAAFGAVRQAVGGWREHLLNSFESPALEASAAHVRHASENFAGGQRSALAAMREFFTLSPLWMRAATGFATVVICVLVAIGVSRLVEKPKVVVMEKPVPIKTAPSEAEISARVEQRVREELAVRENKGQNQDAASPGNAPSSQSAVKRTRASNPSNVLAGNKRMPPVVQPSQRELQLIAGDLQLTTKKEEEDLPSLYNLLEDESN